MLRLNRRFYDKVAVGNEPGDNSFQVLLAGRPVRTPGGARLRLTSAALAAAVANEWLAQQEQIRPETMPLTRLAATATDRMCEVRGQVVDALAAAVERGLGTELAAAASGVSSNAVRLWLDRARRGDGGIYEALLERMNEAVARRSVQLQEVIAAHAAPRPERPPRRTGARGPARGQHKTWYCCRCG